MDMMAPINYRDFVIGKSQIGGQHGFKPVYENPNSYDFQNFLIDWALYQGRRAIGVELKESYFRQAVKNISEVDQDIRDDNAIGLFQVA